MGVSYWERVLMILVLVSFKCHALLDKNSHSIAQYGKPHPKLRAKEITSLLDSPVQNDGYAYVRQHDSPVQYDGYANVQQDDVQYDEYDDPILSSGWNATSQQSGEMKLIFLPND